MSTHSERMKKVLYMREYNKREYVKIYLKEYYQKKKLAREERTKYLLSHPEELEIIRARIMSEGT
jgi:hypothetical protein